MTALDDIAASVRSQADAYGQTQYAQGKADQSLTDAGALATAQEQLQAAQQATVVVQAAFDAYKASHPDTTPPPPPPPAKVVLGMNYAPPAKAAANLSYEKAAKGARIYVPDGCKDVTTVDEFKRAYANGVRTYMLSTKDTTPPGWYTTVPKGCTWYGVAHHEPFPEMTPAAFVAQQVLHMPAVRKAGGIPTMVLQAWDLDPSQPHGPMAGSIPPKGTVDVIGFDYYPAAKSPTQATVLARMKAYLASAGVTRLAIGEYGVPQATPPASVALINEWKTLTKDVEINLYWSQTKSPNEYHFSDQTASAWFN